MKPCSINEATLLEAAQEIVFKEGLEKLNIRRLANYAHVSTGSVYNYYDSKESLILAVIENFWKSIFYDDICTLNNQTSFVGFIDEMYKRLFKYIGQFNTLFMSHMELFNREATQRPTHAKIHVEYVDHARKMLLDILNDDDAIDKTIFNETFNPESLLDFVFLNMVISLQKQHPNVDFLVEILERLLYQRSIL